MRQVAAMPGGPDRMQSIAHVPGGVLWVKEWVGVRGPAHGFIYPGAHATAVAAGVASNPTYRQMWKWAFSPGDAWLRNPVIERATALAEALLH